VDQTGAQNLLTLGWGLIGPFYHGHPIFAIAVTPLRYSWRFLEAVPAFVIAVAADATKPDNTLKEAVRLCGTKSGRDLDKFAAAGLTPVPSVHVRAPSVLECPINIECRIYNSVAPPHMMLTPEHRQAPLDEQHTIYFAEVLGTYRWTM
jgi:flavin reductase (DIM6/NTAB) family NADH-FMN oxidoreductase RutF